MVERGGELPTMILWSAAWPQSPSNYYMPTMRPLERGDMISLEMEARVQVNPNPDGLVTSFFTYAARTQFNPPLADEIDFEHLSKQINAAPAGSKS